VESLEAMHGLSDKVIDLPNQVVRLCYHYYKICCVWTQCCSLLCVQSYRCSLSSTMDMTRGPGYELDEIIALLVVGMI